MADTYTLIEKITVGTAGASSVTFTSIPQTYTDLKLVISARNTGTNQIGYIKFNTSSSNFTRRTLVDRDGNAESYNATDNVAFPISYSTQTASTFGNADVYIPNYTSSNNKSFSGDGVNENNSTGVLLQLLAGLWSNSAAITEINLYPGSDTFAQYSTFYLYGIAKEGVNPSLPSAPYATGGDRILYDGTYWYHAFTSSGTFTPKKALTCDYLVVAGGGGGNQLNGGGGAGGLRSTVTATGGGGSLESALSLVANTGYTVTIGAGGAGSVSTSVNASNGSNSVFSTITSTGGGGGSYYGNPTGGTGAAGGAGGGGGFSEYNGAGRSSGGAGTSGQGYAGGGGGRGSGGGGGGAGAVGGTGTDGNPGNGGNGGAGVAIAALANATSTGVSTYYAGGGGAGSESATAGTGGSGGGGAGGTTAGTPSWGTDGTANTGGGGGGSGVKSSTRVGGTGGSGIVIVRYAA